MSARYHHAVKMRAMKDKPHWMELCRQASLEQDHDKFMALIDEIDRLLEEKAERLRPAAPKSDENK